MEEEIIASPNFPLSHVLSNKLLVISILLFPTPYLIYYSLAPYFALIFFFLTLLRPYLLFYINLYIYLFSVFPS